VTKFRIVIATLLATVGSVAFLGAAAHADESSGITNQYYAPTYVPPVTTPPVPTTVPLSTPPPSTPPSTPPTTAQGSHFVPSASTSIPAVKVITASQPAQVSALAVTGGNVAFTGADVAPLVVIGFVLLLLGAALIRRNRHRVPTRS